MLAYERVTFGALLVTPTTKATFLAGTILGQGRQHDADDPLIVFGIR